MVILKFKRWEINFHFLIEGIYNDIDWNLWTIRNSPLQAAMFLIYIKNVIKCIA